MRVRLAVIWSLLGHAIKSTRCRLENGISQLDQWNPVEYHFQIPSNAAGEIELYITTEEQLLSFRNTSILFLEKKPS